MSWWKCYTAERLSSGSFLQVLVAHLMLILWHFLSPKTIYWNWKLVSGSSSVRICFAHRWNHHPFTFNPFCRSLYSYVQLRFYLWILHSPVELYSLASSICSSAFTYCIANFDRDFVVVMVVLYHLQLLLPGVFRRDSTRICCTAFAISVACLNFDISITIVISTPWCWYCACLLGACA